VRHLPIEEITFAAKTGFLSRRLWLDYFAKGRKSWRNFMWRALVDRGDFLPHPAIRAGDVIVPNRRSLLVKRLVGDAVASPPYISQLDHDEICARIALTLDRRGLLHSYMTEADQKRLFFGSHRFYREARAVKFPDLLLEFRGPTGGRQVALEVELTRKNSRRYNEIFRALKDRPRHDLVLFLSRSDAIFDALTRAMKDVTFPTWERPVGFGSVDAWLANPELASIHLHDGATNLGQMLAPPPA
jgi:hypothetical protein